MRGSVAYKFKLLATFEVKNESYTVCIKLKDIFSCHLYFSKCENGSMGRCKMEVQVDAGERNWTLTAQNTLGKVQLSDCADLTKRGTSS